MKSKVPTPIKSKKVGKTVDTPPKDRQFVTALARGLKILSVFSEVGTDLTASEIAVRIGLPQPTVWRLCHTMLKVGALIQTPGDRLRPGLPMVRIGHSAINGLDVVHLARPYMQELAEEYHAACALAIVNGKEVIFVERCEGKNELLLNLRVGSILRLGFCGLGWAYLAGLKKENRNFIVKEIKREYPVEWSTIQHEFEQAMLDYEKVGYVLTVGLSHKAHSAIAIPLVLNDGSIPYVLNCGSASVNLSPTALRQKVAPKLISLAETLKSVLTFTQ